MLPYSRVCFSLDWLARKLCEVHGITSVPKQYLLDVSRELVFLVENDLDSFIQEFSLHSSLQQAIDTVYGVREGLNEIKVRKAGGVSKSQSPKHQNQHPPD